MVPDSDYNVMSDPIRPHLIAAAVGEMRKHPTWLPAHALRTVARKSLRFRVYCGAHTNQQLLALAQEIIDAKFTSRRPIHATHVRLQWPEMPELSSNSNDPNQ